MPPRNLCDVQVVPLIDGVPVESIARMPQMGGKKSLHISSPLTDHSCNTRGNVSQFDLPLHIRSSPRRGEKSSSGRRGTVETLRATGAPSRWLARVNNGVFTERPHDLWPCWP